MIEHFVRRLQALGLIPNTERKKRRNASTVTLFHEMLKIMTDSWAQKKFSTVASDLVISMDDSVCFGGLLED